MDFTDANSAEILSEIGLKQFFADSVEHLPEDYFETNETECSICQDASIDDEITHGNIVKIKDCTHEFHRTCLYEWLDTHDSVKTCPLCRDNLYTKPESIDKACANPDTDVGRYGLQDGIRGAGRMGYGGVGRA
jgi:hypothetical protein